jgi:hypothetical protein
MALDAEELELFNWAVSALPKWFTSDARQREELYGFAKMFGAVRAVVVYWFQQALITGALGPATGLPDWLNQHATDRGTRRQASETDEALRIRLRNTPDALTRASLLAAAQAIVDAEGIVGTVGMVELPRDGAHSGVYAAMTGTGGTFTAPSSGVQGFTPSTGWLTPPLDSTGTGFPWCDWTLTTTGAAAPGNDVAGVAITALDGNAAKFANAGGSAAADAGVAWTAHKLIHPPYVADGHARAFSRRGYRSARARPDVVIFILPYGSTIGTESAVREMLRQKKAAGIVGKVERRLNP